MSAQPATKTVDADAAEGAPAGKKAGKKKLIIMAAPVVLVLVIAGLWFGGILPPLLGMGGANAQEAKSQGKADGKGKADAKPVAEAPTFVDLPEIVANLNGNPRRPSYVKIKAKLELAKAADAPIVQAAMPRLMDLFQTYLREMRPDEFRGSAGTYRLREELIARATLAAAPAQVQDVLFTELIVQ
jgi:flagellar FliL protein